MQELLGHGGSFESFSSLLKCFGIHDAEKGQRAANRRLGLFFQHLEDQVLEDFNLGQLKVQMSQVPTRV